jgi:predicted aldo/keto reductase-like oxidoreductase
MTMPKNATNIERRAFLKTGLAGLAAVGAVPGAVKAAALATSDGGASAPQGGTKPIIRTLGRTGLKMPVVSMGVMNSDNPNLVREALDSGIVMLDTAHGYQRGRNEQMVGEVLKGRPRDSFILATKVPGSNRQRGMADQPADVQIKSFLDMFDLSLQRLGLDHVEILYLHSAENQDHTLAEPMLEALSRAKKSGKARFVGLSTHRNEPEVIRAAVKAKIYDVVLTAYNFRQDHRDEVRKAIAEAAAAGVGIVAMKTQAGAYWDKEKQHPINMRAALKWALNDTNVTTAIPGFTTFDQLKEDLSVWSDLTMTEQEIQDLKAGDHVAGLFCQQCGQCESGCARGLPIPSLMRGYMYAYGYKNLQAAQELVASLDVAGDPCGSCASCSAVCAKGFDLRARVSDIVRLKAVPADFFA